MACRAAVASSCETARSATSGGPSRPLEARLPSTSASRRPRRHIDAQTFFVISRSHGSTLRTPSQSSCQARQARSRASARASSAASGRARNHERHMARSAGSCCRQCPQKRSGDPGGGLCRAVPEGSRASGECSVSTVDVRVFAVGAEGTCRSGPRTLHVVAKWLIAACGPARRGCPSPAGCPRRRKVRWRRPGSPASGPGSWALRRSPTPSTGSRSRQGTPP
jgi:hypothetical protein